MSAGTKGLAEDLAGGGDGGRPQGVQPGRGAVGRARPPGLLLLLARRSPARPSASPGVGASVRWTSPAAAAAWAGADEATGRAERPGRRLPDGPVGLVGRAWRRSATPRPRSAGSGRRRCTTRGVTNRSTTVAGPEELHLGGVDPAAAGDDPGGVGRGGGRRRALHADGSAPAGRLASVARSGAGNGQAALDGAERAAVEALGEGGAGRDRPVDEHLRPPARPAAPARDRLSWTSRRAGPTPSGRPGSGRGAWAAAAAPGPLAAIPVAGGRGRGRGRVRGGRAGRPRPADGGASPRVRGHRAATRTAPPQAALGRAGSQRPGQHPEAFGQDPEAAGAIEGESRLVGLLRVDQRPGGAPPAHPAEDVAHEGPAEAPARGTLGGQRAAGRSRCPAPGRRSRRRRGGHPGRGPGTAPTGSPPAHPRGPPGGAARTS